MKKAQTLAIVTAAILTVTTGLACACSIPISGGEIGETGCGNKAPQKRSAKIKAKKVITVDPGKEIIVVSPFTVVKFVDEEEGTTCYITTSGGISCVKK